MEQEDDYMTPADVLRSRVRGKAMALDIASLRSEGGFRWPSAARHMAIRRGISAAAEWVRDMMTDEGRQAHSQGDAERFVRRMFHNPSRLAH